MDQAYKFWLKALCVEMAMLCSLCEVLLSSGVLAQVLPPPLPTSKPLRFYMSNLAVLPGQRRRGVAAALVRACERLGTQQFLLQTVCCFMPCCVCNQ